MTTGIIIPHKTRGGVGILQRDEWLIVISYCCGEPLESVEEPTDATCYECTYCGGTAAKIRDSFGKTVGTRISAAHASKNRLNDWASTWLRVPVTVSF